MFMYRDSSWEVFIKLSKAFINIHSEIIFFIFHSNIIRHWNFLINFSKFIYFSFDLEFQTFYSISGNPTTAINTHHGLSVILSTDLSWKHPLSHIFVKAYKTMGQIRWVIPHTANFEAKKSLYLSLVRLQLLYCFPVWHLYQLNDITLL